jgi:hypothetical protein
MSTVSIDSYRHELGEQTSALTAERNRLRNAQTQHEADLARIEAELQDAWRHLAEVVVTSLAPTDLDRAAAVARLPMLSSSRILPSLQQREQVLRDRLRAIDANPAFAQRESIVNECEIRAQDLQDQLAPLADSLRLLDDDEAFQRLLKSAYGTDAYRTAWWQLSYYRDWREADLLVETHSARLHVADFAGLRARYTSESEASHTLLAELSSTNARMAESKQLEAERNTVQANLTDFPNYALALTRQLTVEHLRNVPTDELARALLPEVTAAGDDVLAVAIKRVTGAASKVTYLKELHQELVAKPLSEVEQMLARNQSESVKLARPKNASRVFAQSDVERRFRDRTSAWDKRWNRYSTASQHIVVYNDYGSYDPLRGLWWDAMVMRSLDGDFLPSVRHERTYFSDDTSVAQGAVASSMDAGTDMQSGVLVDGS